MYWKIKKKSLKRKKNDNLTKRIKKKLFRGQFIGIDAYIKKRTQMNNITLYPKELKKEQTNLDLSKGRK